MNPTTAPRDSNNVTAKLAVLYSDTVQGQHFVPISVTDEGVLRINQSSTVNFTMEPVDPKDENYVNCWLFEGTDGNLYPAVADEAGALLVSL